MTALIYGMLALWAVAAVALLALGYLSGRRRIRRENRR